MFAKVIGGPGLLLMVRARLAIDVMAPAGRFLARNRRLRYRNSVTLVTSKGNLAR
jgi:hypothetical protein